MFKLWFALFISMISVGCGASSQATQQLSCPPGKSKMNTEEVRNLLAYVLLGADGTRKDAEALGLKDLESETKEVMDVFLKMFNDVTQKGFFDPVANKATFDDEKFMQTTRKLVDLMHKVDSHKPKEKRQFDNAAKAAEKSTH